MSSTGLARRLGKGLVLSGLLAMSVLDTDAGKIITRLDKNGGAITDAHFERYGGKPLKEIIAETYSSLDTPIYRYQDIFTLVTPVNKNSEINSDDLLLFSFLFGLASGSPAATPRQSFALDTASSTLDTAALIQGHKESATIIQGDKEQPYIRQNFIPKGKNGVCAIRYPNGGDCLFIIGDQDWIDIDRNGLASINEFHPKNTFSRGDRVYVLGQRPRDENQSLSHKIFKDGKEVLNLSAPNSVLNLHQDSQAAGDYESVWYYADGRVMAKVPFKVGGPSSGKGETSNDNLLQTSSADPQARAYVYEGTRDLNSNGLIDLPEEAIRIHNERPIRLRIGQSPNMYFTVQYSENSFGKTSTIRFYDEGKGRMEEVMETVVTPRKVIPTVLLKKEDLIRGTQELKYGINRGKFIWYVDGKYVNSIDLEIEK
ncbi:MAG: hypothetical protein Q8Q31_00180 [Nanoarchaeota archaeon]|nr:hypothetical protein [Nanoarchaeota archaeon]